MKKIIKILFITLAALILILLIQPNPYFRRVVFYNTAGINDFTIFPNRQVNKGISKPWEKLQKYNQYKLTKKDKDLLEHYKTIAYLVIKDSSILYENYWDDYSESSLTGSFSMAKSIVSLLIGIAIDEGRIGSVNDPVYKYIDEFSKGEKSKIRIVDLLTMSSGLKWDESYMNPFSVTTKAYYGENLNNLVLECDVEEKPGVYFDYITPNPQLLSIILNKTTGKTLSEYASEKLWKPLNAENGAFWSLDKKDGDEKAYCCFNSNARDFARIGQLILNKGVWEGKRIVSENYLKQSLLPANYLIDDTHNKVDFYGYQWWISNYNNLEIFYARGILGQYIIVIPNKNMVIVRLGHKRDKKKLKHHPVDFYKYIDLALSIEKN